MDTVTVKLLRPLDGLAIGESAEYGEADAKHLESLGAVTVVGRKSAAPPENKMARAPANKAARAPNNKSAAPRAKRGR